MSGLTLDETVGLVADACRVGWVDPAAAIAVLRDALGMSSALCLRLLVAEIHRTPPTDFEGWPL